MQTGQRPFTSTILLFFSTVYLPPSLSLPLYLFSTASKHRPIGTGPFSRDVPRLIIEIEASSRCRQRVFPPFRDVRGKTSWEDFARDCSGSSRFGKMFLVPFALRRNRCHALTPAGRDTVDFYRVSRAGDRTIVQARPFFLFFFFRFLYPQFRTH